MYTGEFAAGKIGGPFKIIRFDPVEEVDNALLERIKEYCKIETHAPPSKQISENELNFRSSDLHSIQDVFTQLK